MKPVSASYPKDSAGVSFDAVIHQTNKDGSPRTTKTGRYFARGGLAAPRTEARAPRPEAQPVAHMRKAVTPSPPARHPAPVAAVPANAPKVAPAVAPEKAAPDSANDPKKSDDRGFLVNALEAVAIGGLAVIGLIATGKILKPAR